MSLTLGRFAWTCLFAIATAVAVPSGVTSRWKDQPIQIDGRIDEWRELVSLKHGVSVAAANDESDLFIAVASSDAQRRRHLLATGLIVWLDAKGGKKRTFGIRIPGAGLSAVAGAIGSRPESLDEGTPVVHREMPQPEFTYLEILGPGKDDRSRVQLSAESDLAAAGRIASGTLLYEIMVPLGMATRARPHSLSVPLDRTLGFGLETPRLEEPQRGQQNGQRGLGGAGGMGRGRGGSETPGARGGAMRPVNPALSELKLWTTVALARLPGDGR